MSSKTRSFLCNRCAASVASTSPVERHRLEIHCKFRRRNASTGGAYPSLHRADDAHKALCQHADHADATKNGSIPISIMRATAVGASLVWRVLKTRCPVSADSVAISASPGRGSRLPG